MTSPTQDAREPAVAGMAIPPLAAAGWRWPATGPTAPPAPLTVYLVGRISAGAAQARVQTLVKALPAAGIAAERWQRGAMPLARAHCLHLFGAEREHLATLGEARRANVKVVLSPLGWPLPGMGPRLPAAARGVIDYLYGLGHGRWRPWSSWRDRLWQGVDLVLTSSNVEAQQVERHARMPAGRVQVVPQGADAALATADPEPFRRRVGRRDFVLYTGPIAPGENQLAFLWAMRELEAPAVVLGDVVPGYEWYLSQCRRVAGPRVQFVPHLEHDDPLLASAYAACGCLVRTPWSQALPSGALEAAMSGTPLVLAQGGCAPEYFGRQALYVRPDDVAGIRRAVETALARGRSKDLAQHVRTYFSLGAMSRAMRQVYARLLGPRGHR